MLGFKVCDLLRFVIQRNIRTVTALCQVISVGKKNLKNLTLSGFNIHFPRVDNMVLKAVLTTKCYLISKLAALKYPSQTKLF
jgi:hypothetical protein